MEPSLVALEQSFSGASEDFPALLRRKGLLSPAATVKNRIASTKSRTKLSWYQRDRLRSLNVGILSRHHFWRTASVVLLTFAATSSSLIVPSKVSSRFVHHGP